MSSLVKIIVSHFFLIYAITFLINETFYFFFFFLVQLLRESAKHNEYWISSWSTCSIFKSYMKKKKQWNWVLNGVKLSNKSSTWDTSFLCCHILRSHRSKWKLIRRQGERNIKNQTYLNSYVCGCMGGCSMRMCVCRS